MNKYCPNCNEAWSMNKKWTGEGLVQECEECGYEVKKGE